MGDKSVGEGARTEDFLDSMNEFSVEGLKEMIFVKGGVVTQWTPGE